MEAVTDPWPAVEKAWSAFAAARRVFEKTEPWHQEEHQRVTQAMITAGAALKAKLADYLRSASAL